MKVVPIDSNELDNLSPSSLLVSNCSLEEKEKDKIFKYVKWVWLDHFTSFPLNLKFYKYLKKNKIKH